MQRWVMTIACLCVAAVASAQESLDIGEIYLGSAPCRMLSGAGSPEGNVVAAPCSTYYRTSDGMIWRKATGTGNTGWVEVGLPTGAANQVLVHTGSAVAFSGTPSVTSLTASSHLTSPQLTASGNLAIDPTGDITLDPGGNDVLPGSGYTDNFGSFSRKWLTLHAAELWVSTLVAQDVMSTIGGRVVVAPTTELTADLAAAGTSISVKHNNLASGDRVFLEGNGMFEAMAITSGPSGSGPYTYSVTRNLDGSGANDWPAGSAVLNTGTTGDGFIDLYADNGLVTGSTFGPTIVGNVRTGTTYNAVAPRWAIGNLNGLYGYSTDTYGAAFGDPLNAWLKIDATNGVRIGHGSTTLTEIDASGNASFTGSITSTSGTIGGWTIGATALSSTGILIQSGAANTSRFSVGAAGISSCASPSDVSFWAGSSHAARSTAPFRATCAGDITSTSGTIGGWSIGATALSSTGILLQSGASGTSRVSVGSAGVSSGSSPSDVVFWAGSSHAARAAAPFRVELDGSLVATDATITGSVTATSGSFSGSITSTSGSIGGWTLGSSSLSATNIALTSGAANTANITVGTGSNAGGLNSGNGASDICIWAGNTHANRASAAFRVTCGGSVTMTSGSISGATLTFGNDITIGPDTGIAFASAGGDDTDRAVHWANGSRIMERTDVSSLHLRGPGISTINLYAAMACMWADGPHGVCIDSTAQFPETNMSLQLGKSGQRYSIGYLDQVNLANQFPILFEHSNFKNSNQYLCVDSAGRVFASSSGC